MVSLTISRYINQYQIISLKNLQEECASDSDIVYILNQQTYIV